MSFEAKLFLDEESWDIINSQFLYQQMIDDNGRPCMNPSGGYIEMRIQTDNKDDILMNWMLSPDLMKNGYVLFYKRDGLTRDFDFEFWDAHCIQYTNSFNINSQEGLTTTLVISPGVQKLKGAVLEKHWRVTDINAKSDKKQKTDNRNVVEYYITDENNNKLLDYNTGDTIILNIITENLIGETLEISLDDKTHDFLYNGNVLENDKLSGYVISSNHEQIELKVIEQEN